MLEIVKQNYIITILAVLILIGMIFGKHQIKINRILDADRNFEKFNDSGRVIQKGHIRNHWDFSLFPGISRIFWSGTWPIVVSFVMMLILMVVYLYTKDNLMADLFKVNLGAVLGAMFRMVESKQRE